MNADTAGEFIMLVFSPWIAPAAGAVIAIIGSLLCIVMFRKFIPSDPKDK